MLRFLELSNPLVSQLLASGGGISTTGGDLFIGGNLFVSDNITLDTNLNILGIATIATLRVSDTATGESGTEF